MQGVIRYRNIYIYIYVYIYTLFFFGGRGGGRERVVGRCELSVAYKDYEELTLLNTLESPYPLRVNTNGSCN